MPKPHRIVTTCVGILCLFWNAGSVWPQPATSPALIDTQADREALRQLKSIYEQAIHENRVDALRPHLHADFHGVMVTGRAVNSFDDLQKYWRDIRDLIGEGGTYTTTLNPEVSDIVGDITLARGTTDDVVVTSDRKEFQFNTLWTAVLQKQDGQWKIRRVHGSMDPVDNPFVREFMRQAVVRTAAMAAIAGVVLGLLFGLVWRRRRARQAATP